MYRAISEELLRFIEKSPSCYHAINNIKCELLDAGFEELREGEAWNLREGGQYAVLRNHSSIIAFKIPTKDFLGFQIVASHSDSPSFKIKEFADMDVEHHYTKLNVEKYGGMICAPWFDRPLSVAGKVMVKEGNAFHTKLCNIDKDLVLIPHLAIHMNREVNDGYAFNAQVDMLPLFGDETANDSLMRMVAESIGVKPEAILGTDLFLYNRMKGTIWGANEEYISSPKLDNLQCAFASLKGFLKGSNRESVSVYSVFDNEEVGSGTKQGAASTFLMDVLTRINESLGRTHEQYLMALASSFMVSADNAHAVHPNQTGKADPTNRPYMNHGIVIKYNANQKYTTDSVSAAIFKSICDEAGVPYQSFTNRSDMLGGSTLGNLSNAQVSLNTVDIGLAQLAMHSPYETAGVRDTSYLIDALEAFYDSSIQETASGEYVWIK